MRGSLDKMTILLNLVANSSLHLTKARFGRSEYFSPPQSNPIAQKSVFIFLMYFSNHQHMS